MLITNLKVIFLLIQQFHKGWSTLKFNLAIKGWKKIFSEGFLGLLNTNMKLFQPQLHPLILWMINYTIFDFFQY